MAKLKFILEDEHHIGILMQDRNVKGREVVFELSEDLAKLMINHAVSLHGLSPAEEPKMVPVEHARSRADQFAGSEAEVLERAAEAPALQEPKRAEPSAQVEWSDVLPKVIEDEGDNIKYVQDPHKSPARATNVAGLAEEKDAEIRKAEEKKAPEKRSAPKKDGGAK